jgi:hypothetical protein
VAGDRAHRSSISKYVPTLLTVGSLESRRVTADGDRLAPGAWMSRGASAEASVNPTALSSRARAGSLVFAVKDENAAPRRKLTSWEAMTGT